MLQQTTVAAVVPYFERFIASFPNLRAMAEADEQLVLKHWEGLGYYRRARHLHTAAKQLLSEYGEELPDDPATWITLPGVGRYILGAVLSQAFDRRLPIVETNSLRVLTRFFGYRGDPRAGEGKTWVWSAAESVLPARNAGDFNQALMELGALVCTPTRPACERCPFARECATNRESLHSLIPPLPKQTSVTAMKEVGVVIRAGTRLLLCQRRADAERWQNMWEFPHAELRAREGVRSATRRIARELTGLSVDPGREILSLKHTITRFAITLTCVEAERRGGEFRSEFYRKMKWVKSDELASFPASAPQRRLMNVLSKPGRLKRRA